MMRFFLVSLCVLGLSYGAEQEKVAKMYMPQAGTQGTLTQQGAQQTAAVGQQLPTTQLVTPQFQQQPFQTSGQVSACSSYQR